jgi:hypothetical protein
MSQHRRGDVDQRRTAAMGCRGKAAARGEQKRALLVVAEPAVVGLPTDTAARIALTLKPDDRANPHGVPGHSHIVRDSLEPKDCTGFGHVGQAQRCHPARNKAAARHRR